MGRLLLEATIDVACILRSLPACHPPPPWPLRSGFSPLIKVSMELAQSASLWSSVWGHWMDTSRLCASWKSGERVASPAGWKQTIADRDLQFTRIRSHDQFTQSLVCSLWSSQVPLAWGRSAPTTQCKKLPPLSRRRQHRPVWPGWPQCSQCRPSD